MARTPGRAGAAAVAGLLLPGHIAQHLRHVDTADHPGVSRRFAGLRHHRIARRDPLVLHITGHAAGELQFGPPQRAALAHLRPVRPHSPGLDRGADVRRRAMAARRAGAGVDRRVQRHGHLLGLRHAAAVDQEPAGKHRPDQLGGHPGIRHQSHHRRPVARLDRKLQQRRLVCRRVAGTRHRGVAGGPGVCPAGADGHGGWKCGPHVRSIDDARP